MSIRTATLSLAPTLYWPMDDATGPAAADATGNGHSGFFTANTALQAPGPEAGTTCLATTAPLSGVQIFGANPLSGTGPFTFIVWIASGLPATATTELIYNGRSNVNGEGLLLGADNQIFILRGGLELVSAGGLVGAGVWHMLAHSFATSGNRLTYLDGALVDTHAAGVPITVPASDWCRALTPSPSLIAHAAFWTSALSGADIATIWAAGPGPGIPAAVGDTGTASAVALAALTLDVATLQATCDAILAAVRKTY